MWFYSSYKQPQYCEDQDGTFTQDLCKKRIYYQLDIPLDAIWQTIVHLLEYCSSLKVNKELNFSNPTEITSGLRLGGSSPAAIDSK